MSAKSTNNANPTASETLQKLWRSYYTQTPNRIKAIDVYLGFLVLTAVSQFVYCLLVGTYPFNSFLSGFISCVGSFVLAGG